MATRPKKAVEKDPPMTPKRGAKTREEIVFESMNKPKAINLDVDFEIPFSLDKYNPKEHQWKCSCCGKGFTGTHNKNFQKSASPLFQANDGFLPWCKECTDKYWNLLVRLYCGNEEHATEHFCQQVDWVYDFEPLKCAREISSDRSRISHYAAKKNLNVGGRKTYIDSLKHIYRQQLSKIISTKEQIKVEEHNVSAVTIDRFGVGFTEEEYKILDEHYKMLKKNNPNIDNNQEVFVKSLCNINLLMVKAMRSEDSDKYIKLTEQYSKTFSKAGLKTVTEKDTSEDETFSTTLGFISKYTPEEFYKDKSLWEDYDNIGEYIERFITRPMMNLEDGTDIRDFQYYVPETDDLDDDLNDDMNSNIDGGS